MPAPEPTHRSRKRDGHVPEHRDNSTTRTLSCSECRRLKLRCDRQWPCQSCVKRGCASICPSGSLTPGGGGNRFILHGSEQLHRKIKDMSERIGTLEDSLSCMWNKTSGNTGVEHPLLRKELLKIKLPPDTQNAEQSSSTDPPPRSPPADDNAPPSKQPPVSIPVEGCNAETDADCVTEELGMLKLDSHGKGSFMGRTARIEFILHAENENPSDPSATVVSSIANDGGGALASAIAGLPDSIRHISGGFLFQVPPQFDEDFESLKRYLPSRSRADSLMETYFEHAGWFYCPITRDEVVNRLFPAFYPLFKTTNGFSNHASTSSQTSSESEPIFGLHDLAVLFMIFAVGASVDLTLPPFNDESEAYHMLARAAICLEPPWDGTTLALIQAFNLMIYYNIQWNQKSVDIEGTWAMMGLAAKFGISLGLHRDSARWKLGNDDMEKRRMIFWELFTMDSWQSLGYGRPPSINVKHVDCGLPLDPEEKRNAEGKVIQRSFQNYKYLFVRECIQPVIEHIFSVKPFTYESIGLLDKKVRSFDFGDLTSELTPTSSVASLMQRHILLCMREFTLLYIHRSFFTRVLNTHPNSPLDSPYAGSVLATFRCAVTLVQIVKTCYHKHPVLISRFWLPYTYLLTSAVIFGSIVFRGPKSSLAPAAYYQLCMTVEMFEISKVHSPRISRALPVVYRLQHKAHKALVELGPGAASSLPAPPKPAIKDSPCAQQDELEAYGGKARLIRLDGHTHSKDHHHSSPEHHSSSEPSPSSTSAAESSRQATPPVRTITSPFIVDSSAVQNAFSASTSANHPWLASSAVIPPPIDASFVSSPTSIQNPVNAAFPTSYDNSPFLQFMQEPSNPSAMPMATLPYDSTKPRSSSGSADDLGWLDGFGVGAPMNQFPLISHQAVPTIFNGGLDNDVSTFPGAPSGFGVDFWGLSGADSAFSLDDKGISQNRPASSSWNGLSLNDPAMDMLVDSECNGNGRAEPALDDATWQQYMQKLFMNGTNTEPVS